MNFPLPSTHNYRLRQPSDAADSSGHGRRGRMNCRGWADSAHLRRLAMGRRTGWRTGLQTQVREDLLNHRLVQDRRNDLHLTATIRAVLQIELEHPHD